MSKTHHAAVEAQFGARARAYVQSAVHAAGEDLRRLAEIAAEAAPRHAVDLGTGGGHVAYALSPHAGEVTACDLSGEMLAAVREAAAERGLSNIGTCEAPVERLPFEAGRFDFLGCRYSAHHWHDFEGGLREARRVLAPGARAVFIDVQAPGSALLDTHLQAVELLRDTSHVRDYNAAEWLGALGRCGFLVQATRSFRVRMEFETWVARMRTPPDNIRAIRALQAAASTETRAHFGIEEDGSFFLDVLLVEAQAA